MTILVLSAILFEEIFGPAFLRLTLDNFSNALADRKSMMPASGKSFHRVPWAPDQVESVLY